MIIYLPCKIGEKFVRQNFVKWEGNKRVYEDGGELTLRGFTVFPCKTKPLSLPTIIAGDHLLEYDETDEYGKDFKANYIIDVPITANTVPLNELGFPSAQRGRFEGLKIDGEYLLASFVMNHTYEHKLYAIQNNILYFKIGEKPLSSNIKFDKTQNKKREQDKQNSWLPHTVITFPHV